jgi:uncharacterized membrane protein
MTNDAFQQQRQHTCFQQSERQRRVAIRLSLKSQIEIEFEDILKAGVSIEKIEQVQASPEFQDENDDEITDILDPSISKKRIVEIQSSVELPFSAEIAYDAYSNLSRQSDWSSWLHRVEFLDDSNEKSKWTMKFLGFKYSWNSQAIKNERPHIIQWKSTSGLVNFGTVRFEEKESGQTTMTLAMTLVAPRAAAALFKKSTGLQNFVEKKMISTSLHTFRDTVSETDVKEDADKKSS